AGLPSPTVAAAMRFVVECFPLVPPLFALERRTTGSCTALRLSVCWPLDAEVERFHTAMMSGSLYAQLGFLLGGKLPPGIELDALHPRPPGLPPWVDGTGARLRFDRPHYEVRFPTRLLDVPLPLADARTHEPARRRCLALLESRPDPYRYSAAVDRLLRAHGPPFPDLEATSRALGLSSRSLRRRLADEGSS